MIFLFINDILG